MRIVHVGPVIGTGNEARVRFVVETNSGERTNLYLYKGYADSLSTETLTGVLDSILRVGPSPASRNAQGAEKK